MWEKILAEHFFTQLVGNESINLARMDKIERDLIFSTKKKQIQLAIKIANTNSQKRKRKKNLNAIDLNFVFAIMNNIWVSIYSQITHFVMLNWNYLERLYVCKFVFRIFDFCFLSFFFYQTKWNEMFQPNWFWRFFYFLLQDSISWRNSSSMKTGYVILYILQAMDSYVRN